MSQEQLRDQEPLERAARSRSHQSGKLSWLRPDKLMWPETVGEPKTTPRGKGKTTLCRSPPGERAPMMGVRVRKRGGVVYMSTIPSNQNQRNKEKGDAHRREGVQPWKDAIECKPAVAADD
ncbi:MAG: hypothetical protein GY696_19675 [Gammaproteobacteria bacterium]|nr:hypothetical protein [Gammaproteobacteria bacterium]